DFIRRVVKITPGGHCTDTNDIVVSCTPGQASPNPLNFLATSSAITVNFHQLTAAGAPATVNAFIAATASPGTAITNGATTLNVPRPGNQVTLSNVSSATLRVVSRGLSTGT